MLYISPIVPGFSEDCLNSAVDKSIGVDILESLNLKLLDTAINPCVNSGSVLNVGVCLKITFPYTSKSP